MSERIAIYPGSFDPVTNGHIDIADRATRLCDRVVLAVATNLSKQPLFTTEERVAFLHEVFDGRGPFDIVTFDGLLVDFARRIGARAIIKGLRAVTDFEYELQMALMNRRLAPEVETVFLPTDADKSFLSSSLVKEVAWLGGDISGLVPREVEGPLYERLRSKAASAPE
jgi:pantetheine-phosphate adenylyltransferase